MITVVTKYGTKPTQIAALCKWFIQWYFIDILSSFVIIQPCIITAKKNREILHNTWLGDGKVWKIRNAFPINWILRCPTAPSLVKPILITGLTIGRNVLHLMSLNITWPSVEGRTGEGVQCSNPSNDLRIGFRIPVCALQWSRLEVTAC